MPPKLTQGTPEQRNRLFTFLRGIGIAVEEVVRVRGFIEGVRIVRGGLRVDPRGTIDAILHEAGHLCLVPKPFRAGIGADVDKGIRQMFKRLSRLPLDPDSPLQRAAIQSGEAEATAWAWAAGRHLGFSADLVILDRSYENTGALIRQMLELNAWVGIHGLVHAGLCALPRCTPNPTSASYPTLRHWAQDGPFPEWEGRKSPRGTAAHKGFG